MTACTDNSKKTTVAPVQGTSDITTAPISVAAGQEQGRMEQLAALLATMTDAERRQAVETVMLSNLDAFREEQDRKQQAEEQRKQDARSYINTTIGRISDMAREDYGTKIAHSDEFNDIVFRELLDEFPELSPLFEIRSYERDSKSRTERDAVWERMKVFGAMIFGGNTSEYDYRENFLIGAVNERITYHSTLGKFLLIATIAIWRVANEDEHLPKWEIPWKKNQTP